jgi:hypothetical protein
VNLPPLQVCKLLFRDASMDIGKEHFNRDKLQCRYLCKLLNSLHFLLALAMPLFGSEL